MTQQTPPKQKSNVGTIIIVIVVIFIALAVGGYFLSRYFANKALNTLTNAFPSPYSSSNTTTSSKSWPTDFIVSIPQYKKGNIKSVIKLESPKTWDIIISDTSKADYDAYLEETKAAGWVQKSDIAFMANIAQFQKEQWDLTVVFDPSSNGVKITLVEPVK